MGGPPAPSGPGPLALAVAPRLAAAFIRATWATSRVTFLRRPLLDEAARATRPFIMAFWHSRLLFMRYAHAGRPLAAVISEHGDGELIARTMARFGHAAVRGSSTRGGSRAVRDALRFVRAGGDLAITPDGPRGPARIAKRGVIDVARLARLPVFPMSLAARPSLRLRSWDRFEVPFPFARLAIAYGDPFDVPPHAGEEERNELALALGARLDALTNECRAAVGLPPWPEAPT